MKRCMLVIILALVGSMLAGCDGLFARATATPTVTNTPEPTATATLTPTPTQTATPTITATATAIPPKLYDVPGGGFSFELPQDGSIWSDHTVAVLSAEAAIKDSTGNLVIYITTETRDYVLDINQEIEFLAETAENEKVEIDPAHFEVGGHAARQLTVWTQIEDTDVIMGMLLVDAGGDRVIYIISYVFGEMNEKLWIEDMVPFQKILLDSFEIYEPENVAPSGFGWLGDGLLKGCLFPDRVLFRFQPVV